MTDILTSIHGREVGLDSDHALVVRSGIIRSRDGTPLRLPDGQDDAPIIRLRETARAARYNNPRVNGVMSSPPTVAVATSADGTLTNHYAWNDADKGGAIRTFGGIRSIFATNLLQMVTGLTLAGVPTNMRYNRYEVLVDATKVQFALYLTTVAQTVRFIVDGQYVSATATAPSTTFALNYFSLTFGSRAVRKITVEMQEGYFYRVSVLPTEGVHQTDGNVLRALVVGDSFGDAAGATLRGDGFFPVMCDALGIRDIWTDGAGGTGYVNNIGGTSLTAQQRIGLVTAAAPLDYLFVAMGFNDSSFQSTLGAAVVSYLTALRNGPLAATTPIFVLGPPAGITGPSATMIENETIIADAVASIDDDRLYFIPQITTTAGSWVFGTGRVGATNGSGNSDIYGSSDGTHYSDAGHLFTGLRAADAVIGAVS